MPICRSDEDKRARARVLPQRGARAARAALRATGRSASMVDERDERGGDKVWHWIKKGVPLRLEIGPRDIEKDALFVGRRDRAPKDKQSVPRARVRRDRRGDAAVDPGRPVRSARKAFREQHTRRIDTKEEFYAFFTPPRVAGERADADPRRLRADALQRRRGARRAHQERPRRHGALHSAREERAGHLSVHRPAEPAARRLGESLLMRSARRRAARYARLAADSLLRRAVGLHRHPRQADLACRAAAGVVAHDAGRRRVARWCRRSGAVCAACRRG